MTDTLDETANAKQAVLFICGGISEIAEQIITMLRYCWKKHLKIVDLFLDMSGNAKHEKQCYEDLLAFIKYVDTKTAVVSGNIENVTNQLNNNGFGGGVSNGFGSGASNSGFGNTPTNSYGNNLNNNQTNNGYNYTTDIQKQQCIDSSGMQCTPQNNNNSANMTSMYPDYSQPASLEFDGQNLVWLQNGQPVKYYPAVSGRADYQSAQYTNERKRGPIPEGDYLLGQGTGEDYNNKEEMSFWNEYIRGRSPWYKDPFAWGKSRIPIQPLPTTNTFGRDRMYVHGGNVPGSAGCIDLTYRNDDFYNDFKNYNGNLPLKVKYPKGW